MSKVRPGQTCLSRHIAKYIPAAITLVLLLFCFYLRCRIAFKKDLVVISNKLNFPVKERPARRSSSHGVVGSVCCMYVCARVCYLRILRERGVIKREREGKRDRERPPSFEIYQ